MIAFICQLKLPTEKTDLADRTGQGGSKGKKQ